MPSISAASMAAFLAPALPIATVATGIPVCDYAELVDSLSLCFSKGLGAPVGSIITGTSDFIEKAHYYRKAYGGGLRQSGILAAAAIYAIETNLPKMELDHKRAKHLAIIFNELSGFYVNPEEVETNIIIIELKETQWNAHQVTEMLKEKGILVLPISKNKLRAVTHIDIGDGDIQYLESVVNSIFSKNSTQTD